VSEWQDNTGLAPDCEWVEVLFIHYAGGKPQGFVNAVTRVSAQRWGLDERNKILIWREAEEPMGERMARLEAQIEHLSK
jgi:hypothetical protein